MILNIKPLSVNDAWQGKRFKTKNYKNYEKHVLLLLRKFKAPTGELSLYLKFGFSSKLADIDNPVKCFIDCLQKKYGFNDRDIFKLVIEKELVSKGSEYIEFELTSLSS